MKADRTQTQDDHTIEPWLKDLACSADSPVANLTHAKFFTFLGKELASAETERQGLCVICVDRSPRNEVGEAIKDLTHKESVSACADQGLVYAHLELSQRKEILLQYHRHRQVPFMAMDKAQLRKLCDLRSKTNIPDSMEHLQLIELASTIYEGPCAPNGLLNDSTSWEEAGASSSVGTSASSAGSYQWTLDDTTTKYEAHRAALRAGVDVRGMLGNWPLHKAKPAAYAKAIRAKLCQPSWTPISIPPVAPQISADADSSVTGTITGITPLSLRCQSLDPERQGFLGIGRLGLLYSPSAFRSRLLQLLHIIDHTEKVNPGLQHCWICWSWYLSNDDTEHNSRCRAEHFSQKPRPLTADDFRLTIRMPNATEALDGIVSIPLDESLGVYTDK